MYLRLFVFVLLLNCFRKRDLRGIAELACHLLTHAHLMTSHVGGSDYLQFTYGYQGVLSA